MTVIQRVLLWGLLGALPANGDLAPAAMHADLAALERSIRANWAYLELREEQGLDLAASFRRAGERAGEALEPAGFALVLRELVAELRDGHAYVQVPGVYWPPRRLPVLLGDTREGIAVVRLAHLQDVVEGGPAPRVGDLVHGLDGRPPEEELVQAMRQVYASTPGMLRRMAFVEMGRIAVERETVELELEAPDGERRRVVLRTSVTFAPGLDDFMEPQESWVLSFPREEVALLRVPSFAYSDPQAWSRATPAAREELLVDAFRTIDEHFEEIARAGARALVLDLRGNSGGTDLLGQHLARHLFTERFTYYRLASKRWPFGWGRPSRNRYAPGRGMHVFRGPLFALIDEGCFSVTDNLLRCLTDEHPDFTTIGRPTGGGTGAPRALEPLPTSRAVITLCTMRVYGPAGDLIEGIGTQPTIPVTPSRADLAAGHDPDLAAALRLIDERAAAAGRAGESRRAR